VHTLEEATGCVSRLVESFSESMAALENPSGSSAPTTAKSKSFNKPSGSSSASPAIAQKAQSKSETKGHSKDTTWYLLEMTGVKLKDVLWNFDHLIGSSTTDAVKQQPFLKIHNESWICVHRYCERFSF
jgi:hypothetical protein